MTLHNNNWCEIVEFKTNLTKTHEFMSVNLSVRKVFCDL